jgi:hypothetical protein
MSQFIRGLSPIDYDFLNTPAFKVIFHRSLLSPMLVSYELRKLFLSCVIFDAKKRVLQLLFDSQMNDWDLAITCYP